MCASLMRNVVLWCLLLWAGPALAQDDPPAPPDDVLAGHSYHGEAFNEGPRQHAYLMEGLGRADFAVSSAVEEARQFFNQGIDQLHGFWYFEAERSFRQVVVLDPDCVMAYWGLAMANVNNEERARQFIGQAREKSGAEDARITPRELLYIDALEAYYDEGTKDKKRRAGKFVSGLEKLVLEYPDDIEARAFLVCQLWMNERAGLKISSPVAVNAVLDQIFEVDPLHPAHHYRIHLWDYKGAKIALPSAARCGESLPDIAHMWHMPGHIYSRLKRYSDAVWQQEASARVDHRHMMHDRVLPDQIHNFAHNNEWCVRNLNHVGRVRDAVELATNMISMPRHPKYNTLKKRGSTYYGRLRLFETLSRYELWQELAETCGTAVLEPTADKLEQIKRLRYLGRARFRMGDSPAGEAVLEQLEQRLAECRAERDASETKAGESAASKTGELGERADRLASALPRGLRELFLDSAKKQIRRDHRKRKTSATRKAGRDFDKRINVLNRAIAELQGYQLIGEEKYDEALKKLEKAGEVDAIYRCFIRLQAGQKAEALKRARKYVDGHENEVQPLAMLTWLLHEAGETDAAEKSFEQLRQISGSIDMESPVFERLSKIAPEPGVSGDWRVAYETAEDFGERPDLRELGPFRWQPVEAPGWQLVDSRDNVIALKQYQGQPVIVIFYLGHGCLHCAEQLQKFAPMLEEFSAAGIEMVAISTDDREGLKQSIDGYGDSPLPIQLVANPEFDVFRAWRVFDEFENQPLHGTFLLDGEGKILWQDVSYEPFMEPGFLLQESRRLLAQ